MQGIFLLVTVLCIIIVTSVYEQRIKVQANKKLIKEHYGKKPTKKEYSFEMISMYWTEYGKQIPEDESIDDVTWNDLEMNHIFSRINTCCSFVGEQILYSELHHLPKNKQNQINIEEKINFFASHNQDREKMQFLLSGLGKDEVSYYLPMFIDNLDALGITNIWFYKLMQILLFVSIIPAVWVGKPLFLLVTAIIFVINVVIYALNKMKHEVYMDTLDGMIRLVKSIKRIVNDTDICYNGIPDSIKEKIKLFGALSHMIGSIQKKKQASMSGEIMGLLYDYLIGATLWDFIKYDRIICFLRGKQEQFMELYQFAGEIDMMISIASFRESLPFFCEPYFTEERILKAEELYHPFLELPVCNSMSFSNNCIITGSNASGKSTFIKAVAINSILAQNINTCMAKTMVLPNARVITSMAVRDDLLSGESYFIKEIKYLNRIIQSIHGDRYVICVIDEILSGTNTQERIAASTAVLNYLNETNCFALVASHDIELTQLMKEGYDNYYFSEQMKNMDIRFDYKIHKGVSNTKNAIKLLEYIGFPKQIITEAKQIINS